MRTMRYLVNAVALIAAAGASSAEAANWDPPNTAVTSQLATGTTVTWTAGGAAFSCSSVDFALTAASATQSVARTTAAHNPVNFTNCSSGALGVMTVTTFGTWSLTANSTTSVTLQAASGSPSVPAMQMKYHEFPSCTVSIGSFDLPNNTWSNATHNLVLNSSATFPVSSTAGCLGLMGSTGTLAGTFNVPAASIT